MRFDTVIFYLCVVWSVLIEASLSPKDKKKDKKDQVNLIMLNQLFAIQQWRDFSICFVMIAHYLMRVKISWAFDLSLFLSALCILIFCDATIWITFFRRWYGPCINPFPNRIQKVQYCIHYGCQRPILKTIIGFYHPTWNFSSG